MFLKGSHTLHSCRGRYASVNMHHGKAHLIKSQHGSRTHLLRHEAAEEAHAQARHDAGGRRVEEPGSQAGRHAAHRQDRQDLDQERCA